MAAGPTESSQTNITSSSRLTRGQQKRKSIQQAVQAVQQAPQKGWFEAQYCSLWQYIDTGHRSFMATSWATLWPVYLKQAVQEAVRCEAPGALQVQQLFVSQFCVPGLVDDSNGSSQEGEQLCSQLNTVWAAYQAKLTSWGFPAGDGSQLLLLLQDPPGNSGQHTSSSARAAVQGDIVRCGLWWHLHPIFFQDDELRTTARSPFDLACDQQLWGRAALTMPRDVEDLVIEDEDLAAAVDLIQKHEDRCAVREALQKAKRLKS
eukprot:gene7821-8018_t